MTLLDKRQAQIKQWVKDYHIRLFGKDNPSHPLPQVKWTKAISTLGASNQSANYLKFSIPFVEQNIDNERVLEVLVIHEVCHLVVMEHNKDFARVCRQFGDDVPVGAAFEFPTGYNPPQGKYYARCSKCGQEYTRARTCPPPKSRGCWKCKTPLTFKINPKF